MTAQSQDKIRIKNARMHNLKGIDLEIPKNKLTVITGLSGSGKSSLAFDTLYAEGQRRYVESLSSYARQFLGRIQKPQVDSIHGLAPAIAVEQRIMSANPRSTVGTVTEIYDYLKVLFARFGKTHSPISGEEVKRDSVEEVTRQLLYWAAKQEVYILSPLVPHKGRKWVEELQVLLQKGFTRVLETDRVWKLSDPRARDFKDPSQLFIILDRVSPDGQDPEQERQRWADSIQTAFYEGHGKMFLYLPATREMKAFSEKFERDGLEFEEPSVHLFSFNNPLGACPRCEGFGSSIGLDEDKIIPHKHLSVYEDAVACWKGEKLSAWKRQFIKSSAQNGFPVHRPYNLLTQKEKDLLWQGDRHTRGILDFFKELEEKTYKIQNRVLLARYRGKTRCPECGGTRLRKEAGYVKLNQKSLAQLVDLELEDLQEWLKGLDPEKMPGSPRLLQEIEQRLSHLNQVGLRYLTLNRASSTLSGGETQRINLARFIGSSLVGALYVLDEPSIGLHPADTRKLIHILLKLRDLGNTVIVVEHDREIMEAADHIIDLGPGAGSHGGELMFSLEPGNIHKDLPGHTAQYLANPKTGSLNTSPRKSQRHILLKGARLHNLQGFDLSLPLGVMSVVTGVSGSGKSSLIKGLLYPALERILEGNMEPIKGLSGMEGSLDHFQRIELVDQQPIGRSSRSNPVTYVKAWDEIRKLLAEQRLSLVRGYKPGHFSFNMEGGRCDTCQGDGRVKIEMQFMADLYLVCETCKGKRFKQDVLEVEYEGKNVHQVLDMTVDEAIDFFAKKHLIVQRLKPLQITGLGYIKLGQESNTLSGGEAQRIKLASFLGTSSQQKIVFLFDEPTTGLHFYDIDVLMRAFDELVEQGHTVVLIEHHPDVIRRADHIIDLGPGGGRHGGQLLYAGPPADIKNAGDSVTAQYL